MTDEITETVSAEITADASSGNPKVSCATCQACCCRLEVMLMGDDDVPHKLTEQDRWGGWIMTRFKDGWCAALDRSTMLCTIYERRPMICHDYQMGDSECVKERLQLTPLKLKDAQSSIPDFG